ncbi:MAG: hypothetical protein IH595_01530 [Bacteroidales bacterium]|nr:hypothetical protein [Bacteroidales bacterium]
MFKKFLLPIAILGMILFTQCTDIPVTPDSDNPALLKKGSANKGGGQGGGGNGSGSGKGNGGLNAGNGGGGGVYGDLVICLRTPEGIPIYQAIAGEKEVAYYPLPIKINALTLEPVKNADGTYATFQLDEIGDVIPEAGYIVQEVEFGRLNVVRAPQSVFDKGFTEAVASLTQPGITAIKTDASGRLVAIVGAEDWLVNYDNDPLNDEANDKTIDAPREDLAIYQELMSNGLDGRLSFLRSWGYTDNDVLRLAQGAFAGGADKTGTVNVDEIAYMNDWIVTWSSGDMPDPKGRHYYHFTSYNYNRAATYANKFVRITELRPNGSWTYTYKSLLDIVPWTSPKLLIDYANGANTDLTGFANAADDAVQVLEFIHESDLVVYSPYFTSNGYGPPND